MPRLRPFRESQLELDDDSREAFWDGQRLELPPETYMVLQLLARAPHKIHSPSEIIGNAIGDLLSQASLTPEQYEAINTLVDNQDHLARMNDVMDALGRELALMAEDDATRALSEIAVEGLDGPAA
jgi:hypothetical protein